MKKLTKKQLEIYNWLLDHPGYLKKGFEVTCNRLADYNSNDILIARDEAKSKIKTQKDLGIIKLPKYKNHGTIIRKSYKIETECDKIYNEIKQMSRPKKANVYGMDPDNVLTRERNTPGTYFVTGCTHAPWHNKKMYTSVFNYLAKENISLQGLILAGDFLDLNSLSSHDKGKKPLLGVTLDWEYQEAGKFLDEFDSLKYNKGATKDFIGGNHEDRYLRLLRNNDESKYGKALKSPEEGLNLIKRGYNVYTDWKNDWISIGKHLEVGHGEFCSTHVSKKMIDTFRKSVVFFHTHREQLYIEGNVGGFNMGSGADFDAPIFGYATRAMKNSWVNACCLVHLDNEGFFHIQTLRYFNGKLIINGREY